MNLKLKQIADAVRSEAEHLNSRNLSLGNLCHVVSYSLATLARGIKSDCTVVAGYFDPRIPEPKLRFGDIEQKRAASALVRMFPAHHVWVESDGAIWDLTLTQFDPSADPVSVLPMDDFRYTRTVLNASDETSRFQLEVYGLTDEATSIMIGAVSRVREAA